ncbi:MAG: DbpA RNA binding domain-containing protein [Treponema sp.]|jgi:hypothetical protein|nr:DbpA RNA binding domain-containing protein [Treponema sp.]
MAFQIDSGRLKKRIAEALEKTYTQADPKILSRYLSIFKKEVSFFRRSYFTAYLLMELDQEENRKYGASREKNFRGSQKPAQDRNERERREARKFLPDEDSVRLFISIGRSRRVFPREILGLISSKTPASRDDVGNIRIFDNYSFIQVKTEAADDIIEALNGISFRGRSLTVNYAHGAEEKPETEEGGEFLPRGGDAGDAEDAAFPEEDSTWKRGKEESSIQDDDDYSGGGDI